MSGITVQLVFAFVGTRVPYHLSEVAPVATLPARSVLGAASVVVSHAASSASSRAESLAGSPHRIPHTLSNTFTLHDLLSQLTKVIEIRRGEERAAPGLTPSPGASPTPSVPSPSTTPSREDSASVKAPAVEVFDYATLTPLNSGAALYEEQVLLVICDLSTTAGLVDEVQLKWLDLFGVAHHRSHTNAAALSLPSDSETEGAICTMEEKLRNMVRALQALCRPIPLHLSLLEKELIERGTMLATQKDELERLRALSTRSAEAAVSNDRSPGAASPATLHNEVRFPLLVELEPSLATDQASGAAEAPHLRKIEVSLTLCEPRTRGVESLVQRAAAHNTKILGLVEAEKTAADAFDTGKDSVNCANYVEGNEQDRGGAEVIMHALQTEMSRRLKAVRQIVAYITQVRRLLSKAKHEMSLVELILSHLSLEALRPCLLEEAESLLRRRVVLRRAARRQILLLQETEFVELQRDLESFSQRPEVQKIIPEKVRWHLRAAMPNLQPKADPVATLLDHALIDREEDAAQALVEKACMLPPPAHSSGPADDAQRIAQTLLPVERLVKQLGDARAEAAMYRSRVEELEEKLKVMDMAQRSTLDHPRSSLLTVRASLLPAAEEASLGEGDVEP